MPKKRNKVKFNLRNVYIAKQVVGEDGALTYMTPKPIPGAVSLTMQAQGDANTFYADGIAYYVSHANSGYQGDLSVALIPEWFYSDILQEELDETDQVLVENSTVETSAFAMLFQFDGDAHGVRHVLYNCTAGRPDVAGETTTNTKEPQPATLSVTAAPMADGKVKARTTANTPDATYNSWFESVWMPKITRSYDPNSAQPLPTVEAA